MPVAVSRRRTPGQAQQVQIAFPGESAARGLMHDCTLGSGVRVRVDAASPGQWHVIWVDAWNEHARPLLEALIGARAVHQLDGLLDCWPGAGPGCHRINFELADQFPPGPRLISPGGHDHAVATRALAAGSIDLKAAMPWLRVAALDALDRWLQLPLNQTLVDAERGVARGYAASTLEPGGVRNDVLAEALRLARAASRGLVEYLGRLARSLRPAPESLRKVLDELIEGYHSLAAQIGEPDEQLRAVVKAGREVLDRLPTGVDGGCSGALDEFRCGWKATPAASFVADVISLIDPRQIPARVLRLSAEPGTGEVRMRVMRANGRDAVVVEAPAYEPGHGHLRGESAAEQLVVRLIDTMTGADVDGALLTLRRWTEHAPPVFRAVVPLPGIDLRRLRADVYDGTSDEPPAESDEDPDLMSVRGTAVLLAKWRQLAAAARLGRFQASELTAQARAISGDPQAAAEELAERGEPVRPAGSADRWAMTAGAGDLLMAEVDAASGLIVP